jgi:xylose isomerase
MRTYLILKEKAKQWKEDKEIQELLHEVNRGSGQDIGSFNPYTSEKAKDLKVTNFDRRALAERGLAYERLDQLTMEVLLGVR